MSDSLTTLRRKIRGVQDLQSVVRTMKAMAAATVGPCERALAALAEYRRNVELGLSVCFRHAPRPAAGPAKPARAGIGAIVFGSDQGMVGHFNEQLAEWAAPRLPPPGDGLRLWAVGGRIAGHLEDLGHQLAGRFATPNSVAGITPLISEVLLAIEEDFDHAGLDELLLFHNQPRQRSGYEPVSRRLLPLDDTWRRGLEEAPWPTRMRPEPIAGGPATLDALVREFLFVSLFETCAESVAAENARRFAAMQGAEQNIAERLSALTLASNRRRQASIDEELFDLIAGYQVLLERKRPLTPGRPAAPPSP